MTRAQFTRHAWASLLSNEHIIISMDGKGRWADNVYVERFWRTLKYECIFMLGIETVDELHTQVAVYVKYYNERRLHSALGYKTPKSVYLANLSKQDCEFIHYCDWPPNQERIINSKKTVRPTILNNHHNCRGKF